jgi:hypothetical protein
MGSAMQATERTMNTIRSMSPFSALFRGPMFLAAAAVLALRFDDPKHPHGEIPLPLPGASADANDPHAEMRRLFGKIERELRDIDRLLADASAGGADGATAEARQKATAAVQGLKELLATSEEHGKSVVAGIDRILELAQHEPCSSSSCESAGGMCKNPGSSGSSGKDSKQKGNGKSEPGDSDSTPGKSPLDRQGENSTQREATPQAPDSSQAQNGRDQQKDGQPKPSGTPKGNEASKTAAKNNPANPPGASPTDAPHAGASAVDKWGDLPVHVRDVFRAQGGGDMPAQYRDWIDAYYRRMAKRSGS